MAPNAYVVSGFLPHNAKQLRKDGPCEPPLVLRLGPDDPGTRRGHQGAADRRGTGRAEFRGRPGLLGWQAETDADGRFQWTNAPNEVVVLKVDNPAEGQVVRRFGPGARDGEIVVTMPAPFCLRGKVRDAETGRPIDRFRLIDGLVWTHDFAPDDDDRRPVWTDHGDTIVGGSYEIRFPQVDLSGETPDEYALLVVRIEAEGYAPATSTGYWVDAGLEWTCDFTLRKRPWIKGTVRAPDGSPAAGAEVVVAPQGQPVPWIYNGRLASGWTGDVVRTGPDGRYAFAKPDAPGRVVIVSDGGLAQRTIDELAAEPDVTLEPWGRIRGQLRVGAGAVARRLVGVFGTEPDHRGEPVIRFSGRTLTDAEGHFLLDPVAPGHAVVYRPHWRSDGTILRSHRQVVEAASGQTAEVIVGGAGRPIVGRLTRAAGLPKFDLALVRGRLRLIQPSPEFPEGFGEWDEKRRQEWWDAFYRTEEGRRYYEQGSSYAVKVQPDGSFRVNDVPEGRYRLVFDADPLEGPTRVAELRVDPDVPAGPDEKPMDLGALMLMAH